MQALIHKIKSLSNYFFSKTRKRNPIKHISHIQFNNNSIFSCFFTRMSNFLNQNNVINNIYLLHKPSLILINEGREQGFNSASNYFGQDFIERIAKWNGSKSRKKLMDWLPWGLEKERKSLFPIQVSFLLYYDSTFDEIPFYNVPVYSIKEYGETIRSRIFIGFQDPNWNPPFNHKLCDFNLHKFYSCLLKDYIYLERSFSCCMCFSSIDTSSINL